MRLLLALLLLAQPARAEGPILVAAASSLGPPLREILSRYPEPTRLVLASSGKLFAQIEKGAPYALYLPADPGYLQRLPEGRLLEAPRILARGRLVLYLRPGLGASVSGPEVLTAPEIRRVAIANPKFAPYGKAALAVLERRGLYPAIAGKLVYAESVAQAARLAAFATEAAWLDLASARRLDGPYWLAPESEHPPLLYAAGLLQPRGRPLLAYLQGPEARAVFRAYGLEVR